MCRKAFVQWWPHCTALHYWLTLINRGRHHNCARTHRLHIMIADLDVRNGDSTIVQNWITVHGVRIWPIDISIYQLKFQLRTIGWIRMKGLVHQLVGLKVRRVGTSFVVPTYVMPKLMGLPRYSHHQRAALRPIAVFTVKNRPMGVFKKISI